VRPTPTERSALRDDYAGPFDPDWTLADLSRQALCVLGRETLLLGHLVDRVGQPLALQHFGEETQIQIAIEEWMAASPIYSLRLQKALGFEGHDVETVFKNLQFEIGAPQQFMDFQFRLDSPESGEFWLPHCGALLDIEPFGEKKVKLMCHDIEDPTFDATAAATHPRMKMRPIHRPPREPQGRYPHCRWRVFLDEESAPYEHHPNLERVRATKLASIPIVLPETETETEKETKADAEPGGWPDYSGPFDPGAQHEDFSHRALLILNQEAAVQSHLLVRAFMLAVADRAGDEVATQLGRRTWVGSAALAARRVARAMKVEPGGIEAVAKVFQLLPHFQPRSYVDLRIEQTGEASARLSIRDCPALQEGDAYSWLADLGPASHPALDAICQAVEPRARCQPVAEPGDARLAWDVVVDPNAEPQPEPQLLRLARLSRGADFELMQRRPLRH
jgi:hypothetical protein